MNIGSYWARLLDELSRVGTVKEEDGLLTVYPDRPGGGSREIVIVMTPDEWDALVSITWSDVNAAATWVGKVMRELAREDRFLVYEQYDLVPSRTRNLPPDPDLQALETYFEEHPEARGKGGWYAHPPDPGGDQ